MSSEYVCAPLHAYMYLSNYQLDPDEVKCLQRTAEMNACMGKIYHNKWRITQLQY